MVRGMLIRIIAGFQTVLGSNDQVVLPLYAEPNSYSPDDASHISTQASADVQTIDDEEPFATADVSIELAPMRSPGRI